MPTYISPANMGTAVFRSEGKATYTGNSTGWHSLARFGPGAGSPCFPDDRLIIGESTVVVILMPGTGYTVNPALREVQIMITDDSNDRCTVEDLQPNGGFAYKVIGGDLSNMCVCQAAKPEWAGRIVDGVQFGLTDSTNYCPDSPCQGPGG